MRIALIAALAVSLGGCAKSEYVDACKSQLETKLKSPSSLKIVQATYERRVMPEKEARERYDLPEKVDEVEVRDGQRNLAVHDVILEYDADNSYGAALRSAESCKFVRVASIVTPITYKGLSDYQLGPALSGSHAEDSAVQAARAVEGAMRAAQEAAEAARQ